MNDLLLTEAVRNAAAEYVAHPSHALLIVAPAGSGKATFARAIASAFLDIDSKNLDNQPYFRHLAPVDRKAISVESVRGVIHFLSLRVPGATEKGSELRVVLIESAESLTSQAQNALLKTIEEPPAGTVIILTAVHEQALLPTVRSRTRLMALQPVTIENATTYFASHGYEAAAVRKALLMSGGLVGLTQALLDADTAHPLFAAATKARELLLQTPFERLLAADTLARQPELWQDTLAILQRMADIGLQQAKDEQACRRWQRVLAAAYEAARLGQSNAQPKLTALNFMLAL